MTKSFDVRQGSTTSSVVIFTTSEKIAHVDVLLDLGNLLLDGSLSGGTTGSGGTSSGGGGTRADVGKELSDILSLEGLGEKSGPVAFNGVS